jgi:hypothetical protein
MIIREWCLLGALALSMVFAACKKGDIRFGTVEYWDLPVEQREGPRNAFIERQEQRAQLLLERSKQIGTLEGEIIGRQYSLWSEWTRRVEDDPVTTEEVLAKWAKALGQARKARRNSPRNLSELRAWLGSRQDEDIGSWSPSEVPLWLAVGETARALYLLAHNGRLPALKQRPVFLHIVQDPQRAWESLHALLERGRHTSFPEAIRSYAWLPWLQWITRERIQWPEDWGSSFRTYCTNRWLDLASGGYPTEPDARMDLVTTHRLIVGFNAGAEIPSWIPAPQQMVGTILSTADTLSQNSRPLAVPLLAASLADLDSLARASACRILAAWQAEAVGRLFEGGDDLTDLSWALSLLAQYGPTDGPVFQWMEQFGCDLGAATDRGIGAYSRVTDQLRTMDDRNPTRLRILVDCERFAPMM